MAQSAEELQATVQALVAAAAGAAIAWVLRFPAPALTGPALLVTALAVFGVRLKIPDVLRKACFVVIGLSMGTGVSPEVYDSLRLWPLSFVSLTVSVLCIFALCRIVLQRQWKQDPATAILSSTPGHLSYVLGLGLDTRGDISTISMIQATRVLTLTLLVPFVVFLLGYDTSLIGLPGATMTVPILAASIAMAMVLGILFQRLRVPAALLLGGMVFSIATHLTGAIEGHVPLWGTIPAFAIMGAQIGTRFSGVSMVELRRAFSAGVVVTMIALVATVCFAFLTVQLVDVPFSQALIAFAPGGVEAMAAIGVIVGADPTFVAAHHVWRLVMLTFLVPAVLTRSVK
jgi:membrane AbrB-like protein